MIINELYRDSFFVDTSLTADVPPGMVDIYRTFLHELGHAHSIDHVNDTTDIMYFGDKNFHFGTPAINRRIILVNSPNSIDAGVFLLDKSRSLDTVNCAVHTISTSPQYCTLVGITELESGIRNLSVYPNPATTEITINFDIVTQSEINISLYDLSGRKAFYYSNFNLTGSFNQNISTENLPRGFYLIEFRINKSRILSKLILQ